MKTSIGFFILVILPILALTLPSLSRVRDHYQHLKRSPGTSPLTLKLFFTIAVLFFDKAFIAVYLLLLIGLARIIPIEVRLTWWYASAIIALAVVGMVPGAYYLHSWFRDYMKVLEEPVAQIDRDRAKTAIDLLLGNTQDVVLLVDTDRNILSATYGLSLLFGYEPHEVEGQKLEILIPEQHRDSHARMFSGFVSSEETTRKMGARRSVFGLHRDGRTFPIAATISKAQGAGLLVAILRAA